MRAPQGLCIHPQEDSALQAHSPRENKNRIHTEDQAKPTKSGVFRAESSGSSANASPKSTSLLPPKPRASTLRLITCIDFLSLSQKTQCAPPRESASSPRLPLPEKRSNTCVFSIRTESCRTWLPSPCRESGACFYPPVHRIACREPNLQ